jgi:hypothetical protein
LTTAQRNASKSRPGQPPRSSSDSASLATARPGRVISRVSSGAMLRSSLAVLNPVNKRFRYSELDGQFGSRFSRCEPTADLPSLVDGDLRPVSP